MVPEEADRLGEKSDSWGPDGKRTPLLYEAQNDIEPIPETQHHNIDFVLIATATTPTAAAKRAGK